MFDDKISEVAALYSHLETHREEVVRKIDLIEKNFGTYRHEFEVLIERTEIEGEKLEVYILWTCREKLRDNTDGSSIEINNADGDVYTLWVKYIKNDIEFIYYPLRYSEPYFLIYHQKHLDSFMHVLHCSIKEDLNDIMQYCKDNVTEEADNG